MAEAGSLARSGGPKGFSKEQGTESVTEVFSFSLLLQISATNIVSPRKTERKRRLVRAADAPESGPWEALRADGTKKSGARNQASPSDARVLLHGRYEVAG